MAPEHFLHRRVAEELSHHPPFSELTGDDVLLIAEHINVQYLGNDEVLFEQGAPLGNFIYFVHKGIIDLWKGPDLVDRVDPGEMLGLRTLFESTAYQATAKTFKGKDALVYAIPKELARVKLLENPETAHFFQLDWKGNRENFVPSGISLRRLMKKQVPALALPITEQRHQLEASEALRAEPGQSLLEVSSLMNDEKSDAVIIVDEASRPLGILTDRDIRRNLSREDFAPERPVGQFMTSPVHTFPKGISFGDATVAMMDLRIHHLVITEDGTAQSPLIGIISDHDVLLEQALNPSVIAKKLERCRSQRELLQLGRSIEQLRNNFLSANVSMEYVMHLMTQFYVGLYEAAIRLAQKSLGPPPCAFSWLALGSLGRGEQIMRTDQDHALIFEDAKEARYFAELADHVSQTMKICGFEEDHFGVSATNDLWRGTAEIWEKRLLSWVREAEGDALLRLSIVQDAKLVAGNPQLALKPFNAFYQQLQNDQSTLQILAADALRNPSPLNFFKQIKLNEEGQFDLKLRAILPFIDAAKVLAAFHGAAHLSSTKERLEASRDGSNEELITSAWHAYEILLHLRLKFGAIGNENGRYIDPNALDQLDRQLLRNVLKTLEALQAHLKLKFKL